MAIDRNQDCVKGKIRQIDSKRARDVRKNASETELNLSRCCGETSSAILKREKKTQMYRTKQSPTYVQRLAAEVFFVNRWDARREKEAASSRSLNKVGCSEDRSVIGTGLFYP